MKELYLNYLNAKGVLISDKGENQADAIISAAKKWNIIFTKGAELANLDCLKQINNIIPDKLPDSFYRGFPRSVLNLSIEKRLYDRLINYLNVDFNLGMDTRYSKFEEEVQRTLFTEETKVKEFKIVTEKEATEMLFDFVNDLLDGTRPLAEDHLQMVLEMIEDYQYMPKKIASMKTASEILLRTRNAEYAKFIHLQDVIKVVETLLTRQYYGMSMKKLNLKNVDRKFITEILDIKLEDIKTVDMKYASEKKKIWCGLLHHIHYRAKSEIGKDFVNLMRGDKNISFLSEFENWMDNKMPVRAAECLLKHKGSSFLLRHLNYILSRCDDSEMAEVFNKMASATANPIVMIQLALSYKYNSDAGKRTFTFYSNGMLRSHTETNDEYDSRGTILSDERREKIYDTLIKSVKDTYAANKIGKVYLDEGMKQISLPLFDSVANIGYGTIPTGSRKSIPNNVRAFTYWEKTGDVDLSCVALDENFNAVDHFYWSNMDYRTGEDITFSGDERQGYHGGTEYFDINIEKFKKSYPKAKYVLFCNNTFSCGSFKSIYCIAGYMDRKDLEAGEAYEPKSVNTAFTIDCDSSQALLFMIDLTRNEMIWINKNVDTDNRVVTQSQYDYVKKYTAALDILSAYDFFELKADQLVDNIEDADVIVSDNVSNVPDGKIQIKSNDFEKLISLLNNNPLVKEEKED